MASSHSDGAWRPIAYVEQGWHLLKIHHRKNAMGILLSLAPFILAAGAPADGQCAAIPGWEAVIANEQVRYIVIGEQHGTNEIPAIFADSVCLTTNSRRVVVALEQPASDQAAIDAFTKSDGGEAAKGAFLQASIWNQRAKDGRSSEAYFRLFERLRQMRSGGKIASVVAIQPSPRMKPSTPAEAQQMAAQFNQADYEKEMSQLVIAAGKSDSTVLVLTGGFHAMRAAMSSGPKFLGMAGYLPPSSTLTFNALPNGGESWSCSGPPLKCGVNSYPNVGKGHARGVQFGNNDPAYSGALFLGTEITASPPQPGAIAPKK